MATSARLLLIDDDARLTAMVGDYLRGAGFAVETAHTLAEGRERLQHGAYDALLLDLMLPDGDGLDLCRELRASPRTRSLPLLILTARGEPLDRIVGLELGADVNAANSMGLTAVIGAANRGSNDIIELLVSRGARLDIQDKEGRTPMRWAEGVFLAAVGAERKAATMALIEKLMGNPK